MPNNSTNAIIPMRNLQQKISTRTNITTFARDSKTRAIMDLIVEEVVSLRQSQATAIAEQSERRASGGNLDRIGARYSTPRLEARKAFTVVEERTMLFYVETGTFGSINGAQDINLSGQVFTTANDNLGGASVFYTITDKSLPAASSTAFVTVTANNVGSGSNVGKGVLKNHDFTGYADSTNGTLKCINIKPILNGRSRESDSQYLYRIGRSFSGHRTAGDDRLFLGGIRVPGVLDLRIESGKFGIGTVGAVVLGPDSNSTSDLVSAVQSKLSIIQPPGLRYIAKAATDVAFDMELDVEFINAVNPQIVSRFEQNMKRIISNYMSNKGLGSTIDLNELSEIIVRRIRIPVRIGDSRTDFYRRVFMSRGESNGFYSESEELTSSTVSLANDEYASLGTVEFNYS